MKNLHAIYYKKDRILEIYNNNTIIKTEVVDEDDIWFSLNFNNREYDVNYIDNQLGMYETVKTGKNTYETGDFIDAIKLTTK